MHETDPKMSSVATSSSPAGAFEARAQIDVHMRQNRNAHATRHSGVAAPTRFGRRAAENAGRPAASHLAQQTNPQHLPHLTSQATHCRPPGTCTSVRLDANQTRTVPPPTRVDLAGHPPLHRHTLVAVQVAHALQHLRNDLRATAGLYERIML